MLNSRVAVKFGRILRVKNIYAN